MPDRAHVIRAVAPALVGRQTPERAGLLACPAMLLQFLALAGRTQEPGNKELR